MKRRKFIDNIAALSVAGVFASDIFAKNNFNQTSMKRIEKGNNSTVSPRAITMWDFSWLERRWPGAGYEDWDKALSELTNGAIMPFALMLSAFTGRRPRKRVDTKRGLEHTKLGKP
jgi:hypothetical protein